MERAVPTCIIRSVKMGMDPVCDNICVYRNASMDCLSLSHNNAANED